MKKTVALLLGLILILGFALVACGEEEAVTTTEASVETTATEAPATTVAEVTTTEAVSTGIPWTEAGDYDEQEVTITGTIDAVNNLWEEKQVSKVTLVMGDPEGDHFNIAISLNADGTWPEYVAMYESMLDMIVGQTVEVTGTVVVNEWESCFEIILNDSDRDRVPDEEMSGTLVLL